MAINQSALDHRADIAAAGDPEPVRTGRQIQGEAKQKVNQKQTGSHPHPGKEGSQNEGKPGQQHQQQGPNALQQLGNFAQQAYNQRPFKKSDNPFSPIDWAKQTANDASVAYYAG